MASSIPALFESDEHRGRAQEIEEDFKRRQHQAIAAIQQQAREQNTDLIRTRGGFGFAPTQDGEVLEPEEFNRLPEQARERISAVVEALQEQLRTVYVSYRNGGAKRERKLKALIAK